MLGHKCHIQYTLGYSSLLKRLGRERELAYSQSWSPDYKCDRNINIPFLEKKEKNIFHRIIILTFLSLFYEASRYETKT
ncbi:hypothetical protein Csa_010343, partial [Cucumis sativus]